VAAVRPAKRMMKSQFCKFLVLTLGYSLLSVSPCLPTDDGVPAVQEASPSSSYETRPEAEESRQANGPAPQFKLSPEYVIGPQDVIEVNVFDVPELNRTLRVDNDGTIMVPLLGRVGAAGLTSSQLQEKLAAEWGKDYLQNPEVAIFVREFHGQPVTVIGAVEKPGLYYLSGPRTLIEVLSLAGGLAKTGSPAGRTILVTRKRGFDGIPNAPGIRLVAPEKLEVDIRELLFSHNDKVNIQLQPYDNISVTRADIVYVLGAVGKPGGFVLSDRDNITIMQALALAEGVMGTAQAKNSRIVRTASDGNRVEIPVDVGRILHGKEPDMVLAANDILYVPRSGAKAAMKRGLEAAVGTLSGVIVYRSQF
jgi:polysaccharide export outer membrane protein